MTSQIYLFCILICSTSPVFWAFRIEGKIVFDGKRPTLPENSWLVVKLEDVNVADSGDKPLDRIDQPIVGFPITYKFNKTISKSAISSLSVSAVINVGYKASGNKWIRKGDFHNDIDVLVGDKKSIDITVVKV